MEEDKLTGTDCENVNRQKVRGLGRPVGEKILGASTDHENVSDSEDNNTPADQLETARLRIGHPTKQERQCVCEHAEGLRHGVGGHGSHAQGARGLLVSRGRRTPAVAAAGHGPIDIVADQGLDAEVRGSLAEFDEADGVGNDGNSARNTAQSRELLFGRLTLVVGVHDGGVEIGGMLIAGTVV